MHSIIQLFVRHGGLLTLVVLQVVCLYWIASYNTPQRQVAQASWMKYSSELMDMKTRLYDYLDLRDENNRLRSENARLQTLLINARMSENPAVDTFHLRREPTDSAAPKTIRPEYTFIPARVISNNIGGRNNWMIINRGSRDGVQPNSGVITADGLAGIVRYVSEDFSMVMSVLHRQTKISAAVKHQSYFGSLLWDGDNPQKMVLSDIPYHLKVKPRDTIEISHYSLMFPEGHIAGIVDTAYRVNGSNFLHIDVRLSQNPAGINNVYVVNNKFSAQLDQLQQAVKDE